MLFRVALAAFLIAAAVPAAFGQDLKRPNVVIILTDDQGWRDVGYQGSPHAQTPHIDAMAANGVRFDYFYAAQQMCSPGRYALLTGRTPLRGAIPFLDPIRPRDITIAKVLRSLGYRTGHFGKWHLGAGMSHPLNMGFDTSFFSPNYYDIGGKLRDEANKKDLKIEGDSSVFTMDLALDWIRKQHEEKKPFFAYVAFGSPHSPHKGADEFKAIYKDLADAKGKTNLVDFYAELSGIDSAVGKLRKTLRDLNVADNTLIWFASDNGGILGPLSNDPAGFGKGKIGSRTVSCLEWPARIRQPIRTDCATVHMDIFPTVLDIVGEKTPDRPTIDGISLVPLFDGKMKRRETPIGFLLGPKVGDLPKADFVADTSAVWIDGSFKLSLDKKGSTIKLVDIYADPTEKTNLANAQPERVAAMRQALDAWRRSVRDSYDGKDVPETKGSASP